VLSRCLQLTHAATVQSSVEVGRFHRRFRAPVVIEQDAEYFFMFLTATLLRGVLSDPEASGLVNYTYSGVEVTIFSAAKY